MADGILFLACQPRSDMVKEIAAAVILSIATLTASAAATSLVPIDSSLFTWNSPYSGAATWSGNTLMLHISSDPSTGGSAVTQTGPAPSTAGVLPTSVLPQNIIGISFDISEEGALLDYFGFGYLVADGTLENWQPQGGINLIASSGDIVSGSQAPMENFHWYWYGLGSGTDEADRVIEDLGSTYSPFSLVVPGQNTLDSYPFFWLDFRALAQGPLTLTISNINWIVCSPFPGGGSTGGCFPGPGPFPAPEPGTLALLGLGLAGLAFTRRRKH